MSSDDGLNGALTVKAVRDPEVVNRDGGRADVVNGEVIEEPDEVPIQANQGVPATRLFSRRECD
ncbi:hypothetical protein KW782_04975 [Candidatus Parcubacteria bacterium]|nr:hypothetical protein [Candidatus Parcubacteria bacterium]